MFEVVEQALCEVAWSGHVPTVSQTEMPSLVQIKSVPDTIVQSVQLNLEFIFIILEIVGRLVKRAAHEIHRGDVEVASTTTAGIDSFIKSVPLGPTGSSKTHSSSKSHEEPLHNRCHRLSLSRRNNPKISVWKGLFSISDTESDQSSESQSSCSRQMIESHRHRSGRLSKESLTVI